MDKKKVLSSVHLIDILIVAALVMLFLVALRLVIVGREEQYIPIGIHLTNQQSYLIEKIALGDAFVDQAGNTIGTLQELRVVPTPAVNVYDADLSINVTLKKSYIGGKPSFNKKQLFIGTPLTLESGMYRADGIVTWINESNILNQSWKNVSLLVHEVRPFVAETLKPGLIAHRGQEPIARILAAHAASSPTKALVVKDNSLYQDDDPYYDVEVNATILVDETYYLITFNNIPVKIGRTLFIDFGNVEVYGFVTRIE